MGQNNPTKRKSRNEVNYVQAKPAVNTLQGNNCCACAKLKGQKYALELPNETAAEPGNSQIRCEACASLGPVRVSYSAGTVMCFDGALHSFFRRKSRC